MTFTSLSVRILLVQHIYTSLARSHNAHGLIHIREVENLSQALVRSVCLSLFQAMPYGEMLANRKDDNHRLLIWLRCSCHLSLYKETIDGMVQLPPI